MVESMCSENGWAEGGVKCSFSEHLLSTCCMLEYWVCIGPTGMTSWDLPPTRGLP